LAPAFSQWFGGDETGAVLLALVQGETEGPGADGHLVRGAPRAFSSLKLGTSKELAEKAQILSEYQKK